MPDDKNNTIPDDGSLFGFTVTATSTVTDDDNSSSGRSWPDKAFALTIEEVAERLSIHRNTVSKLIDSGKIRALLIGRIWRVPLSGLEEYLAGRDNEEPKP